MSNLNLQNAALSVGLVSGILIIANELQKRSFFNKVEKKEEQINMSRFMSNKLSIATTSILKLPVVEQPKTNLDNKEESKDDYVVIELQRIGQIVKKSVLTVVDTFNLQNNHEKDIITITNENPNIGIPLHLRKKFETKTQTNGKGELKENFYHGDMKKNKIDIEEMVQKSIGQINKYRDLSNIDIRSERYPQIHPTQFKQLPVFF